MNLIALLLGWKTQNELSQLRVSFTIAVIQDGQCSGPSEAGLWRQPD